MPPEELQRSILEDRYKFVVSHEMSLNLISILGEVERVLAGMHWIYLKARDDIKFLSSDNPVTYNDPTYQPGSYFGGIGLANENIEVTFPISRNLACIGSWKGKLREMFLPAKPELIKEINRRTVRGAVREVYASKKSQAIFRLVQKYKDSAPKIRVN